MRYLDGLTVLAGAFFAAAQPEPGATNEALLRAVAAATDDPTAPLLADLGTLLAGAGTALAQVVIDGAKGVYERAVAADNTFAAWMASGAAADAALRSGDVETGMAWSDRMVAQHRTLRVREGPTLLEVRANLLTLAGDARGALRLYSAARAHNQRAGMRWPLRELTTELMRQATDALDRVEFEEAWQDGAHLTLDDLEEEPWSAP